MPERRFAAGSASYRYSINGQEKETELNENITTALYWEYDSRIGRRWNVDPKPDISLSPYSTFRNSPFINIDALGDTTIEAPDGRCIDVGDHVSGVQQFQNATQILETSKKQIQVDPNSTQSFILNTPGQAPARFVAIFGEVSGKFLNYAWDKDQNYTLDDYYRDMAEDIANVWDHEDIMEFKSSPEEAKKSILASGVNSTIPLFLIRPLTIATATQRIVNSQIGRSVGEYINLFKPINEFDVTTTLYRGTTGTENGRTIIHLTTDVEVAATYIQNGGQVMKYEVTEFSIKQLQSSFQLELKTGINGVNGKISTEYMFKGKELVEAINSIARPVKN